MTDRSATVTWVGHASVLIEAGEHRLLTDPTLTGRLAHLRRRVPVPDVGPVDTVLISHLHLDHLHLPSFRRLGVGAATGRADRCRLAAPVGGRR